MLEPKTSIVGWIVKNYQRFTKKIVIALKSTKVLLTRLALGAHKLDYLNSKCT